MLWGCVVLSDGFLYRFFFFVCDFSRFFQATNTQIQKYKTEKGEGKVTESFLFSCDKVNAEVKIEEDGTWHIIKILGRHDAAYKKKKSYE